MSRSYHKPLSKMSERELVRLIRAAWLLRHNDKAFELFLRNIGFYIPPVSLKNVAVGPTFVVKWDEANPPGRDNLADHEARQYAQARPSKRRYLARTLETAPGLLIQERIPDDHTRFGRGCPNGCRAEQIARRLRIVDWPNHGQRKNGQIVFFDSDSYLIHMGVDGTTGLGVGATNHPKPN